MRVVNSFNSPLGLTYSKQLGSVKNNNYIGPSSPPLLVNTNKSSFLISGINSSQVNSQSINSSNDSESLINKIQEAYQNIKNYFSKERSVLGLGLAAAGLLGSLLGVFSGGSLNLIIKTLDIFATIFTAIDYTFFVPSEVIESIHEVQQLAKDVSLKNALNISLKMLPLFFVGKWFFGHKFDKKAGMSNLQKVQEGKIPVIALAHIPRAHIKNLSGGITYLLSWFGRTALCKYISLDLIPKKLSSKTVNNPLFGRFQQSLLFFMLSVFPGWRPQNGDDDFIIK